jgi:hypothetical protein
MLVSPVKVRSANMLCLKFLFDVVRTKPFDLHAIQKSCTRKNKWR